MKIQDIYEKYKIMPQLQLHMLRVAGVASLICNNFEKPLKKDAIISACLLHDMGNIIKFDLTLFPENLKPKGLSYWENVKNGFIVKYGKDEHKASYKICRELNINPYVYKIIKAYGFSKGDKTHELKDINIKVAAYSDHRVTPKGVSSLEERINEGWKRYKNNSRYKGKFETMPTYWQKIEKQIFAHCKIKPEDITEEKVKPLTRKLNNFNIKTDK